MDEPNHEFTCPACGLTVATWRGGDCIFHHYFHENRVKHKSYKELVGAFLKEHPDMKREKREGRNVK